MSGLGLNTVMFFSQLVSFLILVFVLARFVWPLILRTLDKRALTIQEGVENAEKARVELAEAEKRIAGMMDDARREAQRTLEQATKAAERVIGTSLDSATNRRLVDEFVAQSARGE